MRATIGILILLTIPPALAIEKCVMTDGRILYSDTPCPPGSRRAAQLEAAPPMDPATEQRARETREQLQRDLDRIEKREAAERETRAKESTAAREDARRAEQEALQRRQTEALEKLANEQANPPYYVVPPIYGSPPPRVRPPVHRPRPKPVEEEKRYEMAPFPSKKQ